MNVRNRAYFINNVRITYKPVCHNYYFQRNNCQNSCRENTSQAMEIEVQLYLQILS